MSITPKQQVDLFQAACSANDEAQVQTAVDDFIAALQSDATTFPADAAWTIVSALRAGRHFNALHQVADALQLCGQDAVPVRQMNAQALIELGQLPAAISVLTALAATTEKGSKENLEARGSIGRAYKQLYVNACYPELERNQANLRRAIAAYAEVYVEKPDQHVWHGINTVALLMRAVRDCVALPDEADPVAHARSIAETLLSGIRIRHLYRESTMYDCATAAEACWALGRYEEVDGWLRAYLDFPMADAFEVASTRRQFVEIWQLNASRAADAFVLKRFNAKFLSRASGGVLVLSAAEAQAPAKPTELQDSPMLEKVFGADSFQTLQWVENAKQRAMGVARIGKETARGLGTGFLIRGGDLLESLGDELLLLTNAHVISSLSGVRTAVDARDAVITFEAIGSADTWGVKEELWTSPPTALDATLLRLNNPPPPVVPYPLSRNPPEPDGIVRVYIIGHPAGGALSFSLQDNLLLAYQQPKIHYRTPTVGGSSGSPVFDDDWKLLGIHHMGGDYMPKLNGETGTYPANEGIWLGSIRDAVAQALEPKA